MSNQLTQAELIEIADQCGIAPNNGYFAGDLENEFIFHIDDLAKFAQLIQQRQGEVVAYRLKDAEATEHYGEPIYQFYSPTEFRDGEGKGKLISLLEPLYSAPPSASQLVAQALEKAAAECERISDEYYDREGMKYAELKTDAETGANDCATAIRALIDKPVDQGGDELAEAAQGLIDLLDNYHPIEGSIQRSAQAGLLRQALANRRGGE